MSTSRPIALPNTIPTHNDNQDAPMSMGSYTGSGGAFDPASYTKHYLGSPLSWRAGSFAGGAYPTGSPSQFLGQIDPNDLKCIKMASSVESDRGSILNALGAFEREGEFCKNYACCGLNLQDLHALLEHFEEVHIANVDPLAPHNPLLPYPNPTTHGLPALSLPTVTAPTPLAHSSTPTQRPSNSQSYFPDAHNGFAPETTGPVDPDDMELEFDPSMSANSQQHQQYSQRSSPMSNGSAPSSGAPSPPDTPISTPLSAYPSPRFPTSHSLFSSAPGSACPSPLPRASVGSAYEFDCSNSNGGYDSHITPLYDFNTPALNAIGRDANYNLISAATVYDSTTVLRLPTHAHIRPHAQYPPRGAEAFNAYAGYSDYSSSMPGTVPSPPAGSSNEQSDAQGNSNNTTASEPVSPYGCVPPALLWSSAGPTPANTPSASRVPSPSLTGLTAHSRFSSLASSPTSPHATASFSGGAHTSPSSPTQSTGNTGGSTGAVRSSSTLSRPASSLLLSKPFRCPKPNCNKSYKQANGLKYHITHGSCSFTPPKDLEHVQALLASKRSQRSQQPHSPLSPIDASASSDAYESGATVDATQLGLGMISEGELREVEREAERRLRPFACGVGDCQRRYKNMNGLRYHYQHSGDHGAIGLALLASGQHECLSGSGGKSLCSSAAGSAASSRVVSRASTPFQPQQQGQQQQQQQSPHQLHAQQQAQAQALAQQQAQQQAQQRAQAEAQKAQYAAAHLQHLAQHGHTPHSYSVQAQAQRVYAQQYAQHQRQMAEAAHAQQQQAMATVGPGVGGTYLGMRMGGDVAMSG